MFDEKLYTAVTELAAAMQALPDYMLDQPFQWRKHEEGLRFALIGTLQELRELTDTLVQEQSRNNQPQTAVQRVLGEIHTRYREMQALFLGVTEAMYDERPDPREWPLRYVLGHIVETERVFYTLVEQGLHRFRADEAVGSLTDDAVGEVAGMDQTSFYQLFDEGTMANMLTYYDTLHQRLLSTCADLTDAELAVPSPTWWEGETYSLAYRLHRFEAHLLQHGIHADKILVILDHAPNEARQLLRLIYRTLGEAETQLIGPSETATAARQAVAEQITARTAEITHLIAQIDVLTTAVQKGDADAVSLILAEWPSLAHALSEAGVSLLLTACYYSQTAVADLFVQAKDELSIYEAAVLGQLERVQALVEAWDGYLNRYARDGFTPLQLACFFGQEDVALWLIEQGADLSAVSQNPMRIQPIHAAAASGSLTVLRTLLEKGVDVNARQANGFTLLHTAADNNSREMADLLLAHGADPTLTTDDGQTALDWALQKGHDAAAERLRTAQTSA